MLGSAIQKFLRVRSKTDVKKNLELRKKEEDVSKLKDNCMEKCDALRRHVHVVRMGEAFVGGTTCALYDAFTDPRIRLAWQLVWQVAQHQLKTPSPKANVAKRTMRKPMKRPSPAKKTDTL